jgi:hypothetical protein
MPVQAVTGASPVIFISEDTLTLNAGKQYQIPLPLILYDAAASPAADLSLWPQFAKLAATDQALARTLIATLVNQGVLTPVTQD